jgi:hypothetical protein
MTSIPIAFPVSPVYLKNHPTAPPIDSPRSDLNEFLFSEVTIVNEVDNSNSNQIMKKLWYCLLILVLEIPFVYFDFYFVIKDQSCSHNYLEGVNINIQTYLLVSGIILGLLSLTSCVYIIDTGNINCRKNNNISFVYFINFIVNMFMFGWSVAIGFTFFDSSVNSLCSTGLRTYMNILLSVNYVTGIFYICGLTISSE